MRRPRDSTTSSSLHVEGQGRHCFLEKIWSTTPTHWSSQIVWHGFKCREGLPSVSHVVANPIEVDCEHSWCRGRTIRNWTCCVGNGGKDNHSAHIVDIRQEHVVEKSIVSIHRRQYAYHHESELSLLLIVATLKDLVDLHAGEKIVLPSWTQEDSRFFHKITTPLAMTHTTTLCRKDCHLLYTTTSLF